MGSSACSCHTSDGAVAQPSPAFEAAGVAEVHSVPDEDFVDEHHRVPDEGVDPALKLAVGAGAQTPAEQLKDACVQGDWDRAASILHRSTLQESGPENDFSPLTLAVAAGELAVASLLLGQGANKECKDSKGCTPLLIAVEAGNLEMVRMLVESGAQVEATTEHGLTPLLVAYQGGKPDVAALLSEKGANTWVLEKHAKDACVRCDLAESKNLLRCGVKEGRMLTLAVQHNHFRVVPLLVEKGVCLPPGLKAILSEKLLGACRGGKFVQVQQIIRCDADLEVRDCSGRTPLLLASAAGWPKIVNNLLKKGADKDVRDHDGNDILMVAPTAGRAQVAQMLASMGAGSAAIAPAAQELSSKDAQVRVQACKELGLLGGAATPQAGKLVERAVHDESKAVVVAARDALMAIRATSGALPPDAVQRAKDVVLGENVAAALKGCRLLIVIEQTGFSGSEVLPCAAKGLSHTSKSVREDACHVLGSVGKVAQPHMAELVEASTCDLNLDVRRAAASAVVSLHEAGIPLPEATIRQCLVGASVDRALNVFFLLAEMQAEGAFVAAVAERLAAGLSDKDSDRRKSACSALGRLGEVAANYVPALAERAAKDDMWDVRAMALQALGAVAHGRGSRHAPSYLKTIVDVANHDSNRVVRDSAVAALGALGRAGVELSSGAKQALKTYEAALKGCGSASMPRAR